MKQTLKVFGFTLPVFSSKVTFGLVAPTARKGTLAASLTLEAAIFVTRVVIGISNFLGHYWYLVIAALIGLFLLYKWAKWKGSLARVYSFVQKERVQYKENLILLDNGDILQGQPTAYYYNYIDTVSPHLCSETVSYTHLDVYKRQI